jgi:hypothetical protein
MKIFSSMELNAGLQSCWLSSQALTHTIDRSLPRSDAEMRPQTMYMGKMRTDRSTKALRQGRQLSIPGYIGRLSLKTSLVVAKSQLNQHQNVGCLQRKVLMWIFLPLANSKAVGLLCICYGLECTF